MKSPLMTTRRWMVVVAFVGIFTGFTLHATRCIRRAKSLDSLARVSAADVVILGTEIDQIQTTLQTRLEPELNKVEGSRASTLRRFTERYRILLNERRILLQKEEQSSRSYAERARLWRLAALFPWFSVPPESLP
jgi:hypothetical protein